MRRSRDPVELLEREARTGLLTILVLKLVVEKGPLHGYGVRKLLAEVTGFEPPESSVYDALKRLEKLGLMESYWSPSPEGTIRKYYRAKPEASRALETVLSRLSRLVKPILCEPEEGDGHG